MKIIKITSQNRRDFWADYECENCGDIVNNSGYDDRNFHDNVIPNMKCKKCGKSANDIGAEIKKIETKYEAWETV